MTRESLATAALPNATLYPWMHVHERTLSGGAAIDTLVSQCADEIPCVHALASEKAGGRLDFCECLDVDSALYYIACVSTFAACWVPSVVVRLPRWSATLALHGADSDTHDAGAPHLLHALRLGTRICCLKGCKSLNRWPGRRQQHHIYTSVRATQPIAPLSLIGSAYAQRTLARSRQQAALSHQGSDNAGL